MKRNSDNPIRYNRKGNLDSIAIVISLFFLCFGLIVAMILSNTAQAGFVSINNTQANTLLANGNTMLTRLGGNGFVMIAVGLILINVIGAFFLTTHPIFIIVDVLLIPITLIIAAFISNAYEGSLATLSVSSSFPIMTFFMTNLPLFIIVGDVLVAIAAYAIIKSS